MSAGYKIEVVFSGEGSSGKGGSSSGQGGSSSDYLTQVLSRLSSSIDKLTNILNSKSFGGEGGGERKERAPKKTPEQKMQELLTAGTIAAVAVTTVRWMSANANALMAQAGNRGNFAASGIAGTANQSFGTYVGNYYDIEKNRRLAISKAVGQGVGSVAGGIAGGLIGGETGGLIGGERGILAGASLGGGAGEYGAAREYGANTAQAYAEIKAIQERRAIASVSQWQSGFARLGSPMSSVELASADVTGTRAVNAHLSSAFENKFGTLNGAMNPNYNAILGMTPYLQNSPLGNKNGDLNKVTENLTRAGFAVGQFAQITMQASQYQAITGKNYEQFSKQLLQARTKFGDAYDTNSSQNMLNLMTMGYSQSQAQNIAFQSGYNPSINASINQFNNQGPASYYASQALGKILGFDLFNTQRTGQFVGSAAQRKRYQGMLQDYQHGKYDNDLRILSAGANVSPQQMAGYLKGGVSPSAEAIKASKGITGGLSDATTQAMQELTDGIKNALNNVGELYVNATNVTIVNNSPGTAQSNAGSYLSSALINGVMMLNPGAFKTASYMEGRRAIKK